MFKKIASVAVSVCMFAVVLTGCGDNGGNKEVTPNVTPTKEADVTKEPAATPTPAGLNEVHGTIRTEFNENFSIPELSMITNPEDRDSWTETVFEAEDAVFGGNAHIIEDAAFSGGKGVGGQSNDPADTITFNVHVDVEGFYKFNFRSKSSDFGRTNYLAVDGQQKGYIVCNSGGEVVDCIVDNIHLLEGDHEVSIVPYWGYTDFDCMIMMWSDSITKDTYNVTTKLSNPDADEHTRALYNFLCDIYGRYMLTGNFADDGRVGLEFSEIADATGEHFAVLGLDMSAYSTNSIAHGSKGVSVGYAYDFYQNAGGIVQMCWHWTSPEGYVPDGQNWYSSFYKESSSIDLDKIMNGQDPEGYDLLMKDIDNVSLHLALLRDAGVPIIWRPLHEASGGWFWWGDCSAESNIKLWRVMYDKMTNEHNLTNLIWMWNGQNPEWYPGDDVVDIVSYDVYAGEHEYDPYAGTFAEAANTPGETKLVALSENGTVMDPDLCWESNARWLFWGTWAEPYTLEKGLFLSEVYTEKDMLIKAYTSEHTLTLDELPDLKSYRND